MDKKKIIQMFAVLAAILVIVRSLTKLTAGDSMSLTEYAALNASARPSESPAPEDEPPAPSASPAPKATAAPVSALTGASLNGSSQLKARITYTEGFYYEPLSDSLRRYITGVSYPATNPVEETAGPILPGERQESGQGQQPSQEQPQTRPAAESAEPESEAQDRQSPAALAELEDLRYVHIWHYDFSGMPKEGELICSQYIAQDLVEIFYELYRNEYHLEKVLLVDEYDGDADAAREDNNSFCFYYAPSETDSSLSRHALGLALDINPCYNPRVTYEKDGSQTVTPASAADYADRTAGFPYKIDEDDLCYRLFVQHGFTWGGNRNSGKDYQHFQKSMPPVP